ncbi:MAG: GIY-YIG nuclease family protein [Patescibacteria group bacterium]
MWSVYILKCKDGSLYTGITNNLKKRFSDHQNGKGGRYTRSHKPVKVLYSERYATKSKALRREFQIKSLSRKKKLQLMA